MEGKRYDKVLFWYSAGYNTNYFFNVFNKRSRKDV